MDAKAFTSERSGEIPRVLLQKVRQKSLQFGLTRVLPFSVAKIKIARWVTLKCRYGCRQYNRSWCCPPATPDTDEVHEILGEYRTALLLEGRHRLPEFYLNNAKKRVKLVRSWKGAVALERMLFLEGYYKAFGLVGDCCALCRQCAYPDDCRFPMEKRPSVESFSIDMMGTLENIGITPQIATRTGQSFNYYGIVLVD